MRAMTVTEMNTHLIGLVRNERKLTLEIIEFISLFERLGGHLKMGFASMHDYLTRALGYSDDQAYRRLKAARLYNQVPEVGLSLKNGSLNLTQVAQAQKCFEQAQKETGTAVDLGKKKEILNSLTQAKANNFQTKAILSESLDLKPTELDRAQPQSNKTVRLELTLSGGQFAKLKQIKSLLSHKVPSQSTSEVLEELFDQFLKKKLGYSQRLDSKGVEPEQIATDGEACPIEGESTAQVVGGNENTQLVSAKDTSRPFAVKESSTIAELKATTRRPAHRLTGGSTLQSIHQSNAHSTNRSNQRSRYIPASARRLVYLRSGGCCEYVDPNGERCQSRYQLEIDHCHTPFALGGSHDVANLQMACKVHNRYSASQMNLGFETTSHFINAAGFTYPPASLQK